MLFSSFSYCQCVCVCSDAPCLTLCDPMDCSTPGFPVYQQLLDLVQINVHQVSDATQPSHPLSSSSLAFNLSSGSFIRVFSNDSVLCIRWPKYWSFSFSISPSNEFLGLISPPCSPRDSQESFPTPQF